MPYIITLILSALTGFISLSQEILWVRLISFATGSAPETFAEVLGFFLLGIAFGSLLGKKITESYLQYARTYLAGVIFLSASIYYLSIPAISIFTSTGLGVGVSYLLITLIAFLQGGIFTVLCQIGIKKGKQIGAGVSKIYMANIIGSTAGPLVTGFILLDILTVGENILLITLVSYTLAGLVWLSVSYNIVLKYSFLLFLLITGSISYLLHNTLNNRTLEKLQVAGDIDFKYIEQNRHGIITVAEDERGDIIYGNGMYDGRFNIGPELNSNGIDRAYLIAALHPDPKNVLQIGLGSGSWTKVFAEYENIKNLTVLEINPGYLDVISNYPDHIDILNNDRVKIIIDDGRRWLKNNQGKKFDMIIMNTTWNWRSFSTNLLSVEFLNLTKKHLNDGGVVYYNTTGSKDIPVTAANVFEHIVIYSNVIAASDSPFDLSNEMKNINYLKFVRDGKSVLKYNSNDEINIMRMMSIRLEDIGESLRSKYSGYPLITDNNLLTEYKSSVRPVGIGKVIYSERVPVQDALIDSRKSWASLFEQIF